MKPTHLLSLFAAATFALAACRHPSAPPPTLPPPPDFSAAPVAALATPLAASDGDHPIAPEETVFFGFDSARLDGAARATLATVARWLHLHADQLIVVEGHTDAVGSDAYNLDLSLRRAFAVRTYLWLWGIDPDRVILVAHGEEGAAGRPGDVTRKVVVVAQPRPAAVSVR